MPKRRVLLVDDEVPVLLTMKAVLEISGFDVDTATSARDGRLKIRKNEYQMIITDMRMESDAAGREVIQAARTASYHPAVALLTAFPVAEEDWQEMGANEMLVKPMQTQLLIKKLEQLLVSHAARLQKIALSAAGSGSRGTAKASAKAAAANAVIPGKRSAAKRAPAKKAAVKKTVARKAAK